MSVKLPYMSSPGTLPKILKKICDASVPESFNADFLGTVLGFKGGNQRTFISWAKKCDFLNSDGTPTQIYKNFRNPAYSGQAMAKALKSGYSDVYERNEYAHKLSKKEFTKLVSEITGSPHDNTTVKCIVRSFFYANEFADFEAINKTIEPEKKSKSQNKETNNTPTTPKPDQLSSQNGELKLGLNYTINLVLPKTDDPAIYNAIFKSLKENLLDE